MTVCHLQLLDPEEEDTMLLQKAGNYTPTKQYRVLEVLNLQVILIFQCFPAASRYFNWLLFAIQINMYLQYIC